MPGQGGKPLAEEPPRALREVKRLTRNPEKLANADARCWKDTLGRKRSFKTHRSPYHTRRGLVTTWQETKKLLHDESGRQCQGGPEGEKYPKTTETGKATKKNKKRSLEESCESLIVGAADGREERRRMIISRPSFTSHLITNDSSPETLQTLPDLFLPTM